MPINPSGRHRLAGLVATVCLVGATGATVAWRAVAGPVGTVSVAAADEPVPEPPAPPTTTAPSTTSTTTSTSTTVKPAPVPTTVPTTVPRPPATTPPTTATTAAARTAPPVALPSGRSPAERCVAALQWVAQQGLALPAGWGYRCPGLALEGGSPRWGIACWNCEGAGSWIAVDVGRIGASEAALRYVVAHEICHAVDYVTLGLSTELGADLCAALHGAPRP